MDLADRVLSSFSGLLSSSDVRDASPPLPSAPEESSDSDLADPAWHPFQPLYSKSVDGFMSISITPKLCFSLLTTAADRKMLQPQMLYSRLFGEIEARYAAMMARTAALEEAEERVIGEINATLDTIASRARMIRYRERHPIPVASPSFP
jgi:hypothetical protein